MKALRHSVIDGGSEDLDEIFTGAPGIRGLSGPGEETAAAQAFR